MPCVQVHGLTRKTTDQSEALKEVWSAFRECIQQLARDKEVILVGHNIQAFDLSILAGICRRAELEFPLCVTYYFDTFRAIRNCKAADLCFSNYDLASLYSALLGKTMQDHHDALCDAQATAEIVNLARVRALMSGKTEGVKEVAAVFNKVKETQEKHKKLIYHDLHAD
eukprot:m.124622 g.124622  ORF g.124622 m.124622 type:complete len:169 (-) comp23426_c0_seq6:1438-1944(-)